MSDPGDAADRGAAGLQSADTPTASRDGAPGVAELNSDAGDAHDLAPNSDSSLRGLVGRGWIRGRDYVAAHLVVLLVCVVGGSVVVLFTWMSGELYEEVRASAGLAVLDQPALQLAMSLRTPDSVAAVQVLTSLGGPVGMPIIAAAIVLVMSIVWRSWTPLVLIGIGAAGSLLMTAVGKDLVGRARPPQLDAIPPYETSYSFPSGHTLNSTVIAGLVAYLLLLHLTSRLLRILSVLGAITWALAIGLSRVFLGHHWLTDVLVGWTLGLAWVAVVITAHRLYLLVWQASDRPEVAAR